MEVNQLRKNLSKLIYFIDHLILSRNLSIRKFGGEVGKGMSVSLFLARIIIPS